MDIAGYTHEGAVVYRDDLIDELSFCVACAVWQGFTPRVEVIVQFNKTKTGKRRPYLIVLLFGLAIQSGWLF